jgi:hypothetical protein
VKKLSVPSTVRWQRFLSSLHLLCCCAPAARLPVLCAESFVLSVLVLADVVHLRFYGDITSLAAAGAFSQVGLVWRRVAALLKPSDLWFLADVAVGLALLPWYSRRVRHGDGQSRSRPIMAASVFSAGVFPCGHSCRDRPGGHRPRVST